MNQRDTNGAGEERVLEAKSQQELYDSMIIPALILAGKDRQRGILEEDKHNLILQNIHFLVDDLANYNEKLKRKSDESESHPPDGEKITPALDQGGRPPFVICVAAGDEADEIAATMLAQLLEQKGVTARVMSAPVVPTESLNIEKDKAAGLVFISAVPPSGMLLNNQVYKRLVSDVPGYKILAGLWGAREEIKEFQNCLPKVLPENLVTSFKQAVERILQLLYPANAQPDQRAHTSA